MKKSVLCLLSFVFCPLSSVEAALRALANEYVDGIIVNINKSINAEQTNEVKLGESYYMGNLGTLRRTGDCAIVYDTNTGVLTADGFFGLDNLYVRSDDGRSLSFSDNSIHYKINIVLAFEPSFEIQEIYAEKLVAICQAHGLTYDVGKAEILERVVATIPNVKIAGALKILSISPDIRNADLSHLSDFSNLSDDDIAFLEDLLNGKFCPYQHKLTSSRRLTSVNGELTSIDGELATISMAANTLVTDAVSRRMASVKGCLADPFIHALYGHSHGKESYGLGYSNNMGGFVVGADNVWTFTGERYVRLGAVLGYIHGKTKFFGPLADPITSTRHNICVLELFAAYESFNDNHLKTNIGLILGYNHGTDKLREGDPAVGDEKLRSNNVFLGLEFVKNLRSYNGFQFGPWLRANYGHIAQKAHEEPATIEHISTAHHNILVTVVGINVEKEILNRENPHKKATLSLKTGWECRPIHKHSHITASINDNTYEVVILQRPSKNSAVISFAASQKLDDHWSLVGSYTARFNKDVSAHNLSGGMEYSF